MFTSENERRRRFFVRAGFSYLLISIFCSAFGAAYEHFSHGVYSGFMIYAFLFPLVMGALPFCAASLNAAIPFPKRLCFNLYNSGVATLTVGSLFEGVLEIYGTTNALTCLYWVLGAAFVSAGLLLYFAAVRSEIKQLASLRH